MRLILIIVMLWLSAAAAVAQDVPAESEKLDTLFAQLRKAGSGPDILSTEQQIWQLWMNGGSPAENAILAQAASAMELGRYSECEVILNQLVVETKSFPEAFNKRATLYYLMGRYEESLADIASTLDLEPRHFGALSGKGMVLQKLNRNAEALAAYREALTIHPHLPGASFAIRELEALQPDL